MPFCLREGSIPLLERSCWRTPLLKEAGWTRHQEDVAKPPLMERVWHDETLRNADHPVCGAEVAAPPFLDAVATPPVSGGEFPESDSVEQQPGKRRGTKSLQQLSSISKLLDSGNHQKSDVYAHHTHSFRNVSDSSGRQSQMILFRHRLSTVKE